jgi:hypothetical protein
VSSHPDQDISLDALALVEAHHRDDEEGFNAILDATGWCPWYLVQLVNALADLSVLALEELPEGQVDGFLADLRREVPERP